MAGGGKIQIKGGIASKNEALVIDGAVLVTVVGGIDSGPPQEPWFEGMSTRSLWFTDFLGGTPVLGNPPIFPISAGAGAAVFNPAALDLADHPGILGLTTGATAAGRVFLLTNTLASYRLGAGRTRIGTWILTSSLLSTVVERYTIRTGLFSIVLPNTILSGVGFEYDDSQNGGRWQAITSDGVETSTDTGILVTASTWYKLEVDINADGTSAEFFIDGVSVATNVANIPVGFGSFNFFNAHIMKLVGLSPSILYIDAAYGYQEVSR